MALRRFNAGGKKQKELTDEQKQEIKEAFLGMPLLVRHTLFRFRNRTRCEHLQNRAYSKKYWDGYDQWEKTNEYLDWLAEQRRLKALMGNRERVHFNNRARHDRFLTYARSFFVAIEYSSIAVFIHN